MSIEVLGAGSEGDVDLLEHLIVLEFRNLVCFSASCTFPDEAIATVCLLSPTELTGGVGESLPSRDVREHSAAKRCT